MLVTSVGRGWTEPDEVYDFKDAESVDNKDRNEPPLLFILCGVPEREAFKDDGPEDNHEKDR